MFRQLFAAVVVLMLARSAGAQVVRWYLVELFGAPAGTMKIAETEKDGLITSTTDMSFEINRGAVAIKISMGSEFIETKEGKPVSMKSTQNLGLKPVTQLYTFNDDGITLVSTQGNQTSESKLKTPEGEWMPPAAADRYSVQRFKSGAKEIAVKTVDPSTGLSIVTTTRKVGEKAVIKALGRDMNVTKCTSTISSTKGVVSTEYLDDEGALVRNETQMGGIQMVMNICTPQEAAKARKDGGGAQIPDAFTGTFIKPQGEIHDPRNLRKAVYTLSVADGELETLDDTGTQRFERTSPRTGQLTVIADSFTPAPEKDRAHPGFLASTSMCNLGDEAVKTAAAKAIKGVAADAGALEKAEACRRFVYKFISKKSLGVGFATATEICSTKEGDCSEHGVLLCALLRANGIPARVASGLIYADSFAGAEKIFGYHMWAQALIEIDGKDRWVDLDATLPTVSYDATHICLGTSELAEGDMASSMSSVASNMGRLQIKVVEPSAAKP